MKQNIRDSIQEILIDTISYSDGVIGVDEASDQILEVVQKAAPKKRKLDDTFGIPCNCVCCIRNRGFNQAIDEMNNNLMGEWAIASAKP